MRFNSIVFVHFFRVAIQQDIKNCSLITAGFSLTIQDKSFGNNTDDEAAKYNSFIIIFWNDITFAKKETLLQTL